MEILGLINSFSKKFYGTRVFITGHSGFKGSWLTLWLAELGAEVTGYSLGCTTPSHFESLELSDDINSVTADIRDVDKLTHEIKAQSPSIVFHLAAQSLVRTSYSNPIESFETNVIGTANVLEACRSCDSVRAVVIVTSDKCYVNKNQLSGYKETDRLGGHDPYSASKACAELITESYRSSFFSDVKDDLANKVLVASVRAGNVIGGGDWSDDRLIPDLVRAVNSDEVVNIRYPKAIRPWQHVLECLAGYLMLGGELLDGNDQFAEAWNFGPNQDDAMPVERMVSIFKNYWPELKYEINPASGDLHEASLLLLDSEKAINKLGWKPVWDVDKSLEKTRDWYDQYLKSKNIISREQLFQYIEEATANRISWAG